MKETIDSGTEHGPEHPEVLAGTPLHGPEPAARLGPASATRGRRTGSRRWRSPLRMQRGWRWPSTSHPEFFDSQPGETMYHLRMVHYPPMHRLTPEPGQLGCGAHTDYGTLTVVGDDGVGGLQVRRRSASGSTSPCRPGTCSSTSAT